MNLVVLISGGSFMDLIALQNEVLENGYSIYTDSNLTALGHSARIEYLSSFGKLEIHSPREKFHYSSLDREPWRKLAISSANGVGEPYAQFLQTTYFSKLDPQYPALAIVFKFLISFRNQMLGLEDDFGSNPKEDGFWNACRVHHYPKGGGFMVEHKDTHFPKVLDSNELPFLQVMMILSTKGIDFSEGGNYIRDRNGKQIYPEDLYGIGSIVMFDGGIAHGVQDVDPDGIVDFSEPSGRFAAFVNLYEARD